MVLDYDDICLCNSCRRIDAPMTFEWVGTCSCKGQDMGCFANPDNYRVTCPDCRVECSAEIVPKIDGRSGYGHIVWFCKWLLCGWQWD